MGAHEIRETEQDGFPVLALSSETLIASYVPSAGMVCCGLQHRGAELLGQRKGLAAYAQSGSTMGIPLLHPWANRLGRSGYQLAGKRVDFPPDAVLVHPDPNGLPIHGLVGGCSQWLVCEREADAEGARLVAELDWSSLEDGMALFPFPHVLRIEASVREARLEVITHLRPTGDEPVPIAFGYHPYFCLPDVPRSDWHVELPVRRRARLDERCLPTGDEEPVAIAPGPLGDRTYDDLFPETEPNPVFRLSGGGREIAVGFGEGFPVAVVYAPDNDDVVCFEPMTAQTNPFDGGGPLAWVKPGETFSARFSIQVT